MTRAAVSFGKKKRAVFTLVLLVLLVLFFELSSRALLSIRYGASFTHPGSAVYRFYPKLRTVMSREVALGNETFDVLLLGASVANRFAPILDERLNRRLDGHAAVHNLAKPSHTSLDSLYKYRHLEDKHFDLVLIYHGINDVRTNNCPPELFKEDFSQFSWYDTVNMLENHQGRWASAIPIVLSLILNNALETLGLKTHLPLHSELAEYPEYGADVKSRVPFRKNLEEILKLARAKGEKAGLLTFAFYLPADYSFERFAERDLDYAGYEVPAELWGHPENVVLGLAVHNEVLIELSQANEDVIFVDQERLLPKEGRFFVDICHFSEEGKRLFVNNLMERLEPLLQDWEQSSGPHEEGPQ